MRSSSSGSRDVFLIVVSALLAVVFIAAVYLPDIGRGFVKDDFRWLGDARMMLAEPGRALDLRGPDFYRPMVTASFALDYAWYGLNARAYGFTNLALYLLCIAAIWTLVRACGVGAAAAAVGAFAWTVNPHGLNMAVVWISGRTSLLLTLWATLAAIALLRRQRAAAAALLFAALLSKEEALILPSVLFTWMCLLRDGDRRSRLADATAVTVPVVVYLALRARTPALTFATAPVHYAPTTDIRLLAANVLEYGDRGLTIFLVAVLAAACAYGRQGLAAPKRPLILAGTVWFVGGYALTVWIPVRSSLYAVFPSVGAALIAAAVVDALRANANGFRVQGSGFKVRGSGFGVTGSGFRVRGDLALAALLTTILAFIPVYQSRNDRWVEPARLSARVVRALAADPPNAPGIVIFEDEDTPFASFRDALGGLSSEAVQEVTRRPTHAEVVTADRPWTGPVAARYKLSHGRVERVE